MRSLLFFVVGLLALPSCLVVERGPLDNLRRDGGMRSDTNDPGTDAPIDTRVGPPPGDRCGDPSAEVLLGTGTHDIDTTVAGSDFAILSTPSGGNEVFFRFTAASGEHWHFHLAARTPGRDPVVYVVQAPGGICMAAPVGFGNSCAGRDGDEHFGFVAPIAGEYFVGIDDGMTGGGLYTLQVIRPTCGNNIAEHGEPCDGGPTGSPICDASCHIILSDLDGTGVTSVMVGRHNDTNDEAMTVMRDAGEALDVRGTLGTTDCYPDVFAINVAAGGRVFVTARQAATGDACTMASQAEYSLELRNGAGDIIGGGVDAAGCPTVDQTLTNAGRYYVWLRSTTDGDRAVSYRARFENVP